MKKQDQIIKILDANAIKLCCGGKCPIVSQDKESGYYFIKDDFGGMICLSEDHFKMLKTAVDYFVK